ncbi:Hypothetical protein AA314_01504 [Archangium gephyra]|uniref:Uncharacterized protein n=1 Tax=Archangium gephyra TaxID=48 RepID=A0AAC8TBN0_9BACT|nr:Hypothetical protein AA314_01504 [Archangium gephyra]
MPVHARHGTGCLVPMQRIVATIRSVLLNRFLARQAPRCGEPGGGA